MIDIQELEIFCLATATLVDLALLVSLLERRNWQRSLLPVVILVFGTVLFHGAATVHVAIYQATTDWAPGAILSALAVMAAGLLLMPSAVLHCMFALVSSGAPRKRASWFHALLYAPMLLWIPVIDYLRESSSRIFLDIFAPITIPFMFWLALANSVSAIGFYRGRSQYHQAPTRKLLSGLAWILVGITVFGEWVVFYANPAWPGVAPYLTLLTAMSPLMLGLLLAYHMMRYQVMQIIIERSLVYGVMLVVAMLFHHIFLKDLFNQLSEQAQTDLALLEGAFVIVLILAIQPIRQRVSEALRYLLGSKVSESRDATRKISIQMRELAGRSPSAICNWFLDSVTRELGFEWAAIWLFNRERTTLSFANDPTLWEISTLFAIDRAMREESRVLCQAFDAPETGISNAMHAINASLILLIDNESNPGLVALGPLPRGKALNEEQRIALVLLAEQLSITLHNSELQASRLVAERKAIHNEKLSTLGLVASSIAHEIKNPLSSIKAIIMVMSEDQEANAPYREDLEIVRQEIDRLSDTVTRLLKFVRPAQQSNNRCDVQAVVEDTLRVMKHVAEKNAIAIQSEFDGDLLAEASESTMRDIVFNLIANAVDAVGRNGEIDVTAWREQKRVSLRIRDSGPGVSPEIEARLYEPFISDKMHGTGLGLYMVGRHIQEIGGSIDYRNQNGAEFIISIPAVKRSQAA